MRRANHRSGLAFAAGLSLAAFAMSAAQARTSADSGKSAGQLYLDYMAAVNRHDVDAAMSWIAPDAVYQAQGRPIQFSFADERNVREWEIPMQAEFEYAVMREAGDCVVTRHVESNLLLQTLQARREVLFEHCFRAGKIARNNLLEVRELGAAFPEALAEFQAWLAAKPAATTAGILQEGRLIYTGEGARKLLPFLTEFRELREAARARNEPVMRSYIEALNRHDVDGQYSHYTADIYSVDEGRRLAPNKEGSRTNREFESANHTVWSYRVLGAGLNSLDMVITESMDFYQLLGVGPRSHHARYHFQDGKISQIQSWDWTQAGRPYSETRKQFLDWALQARPTQAARVTQNGDLLFTRDAAPLINELLRAWTASNAPSQGAAAPAASATALEKRLRSNPNDVSAVRELHLLLASANDLSREESLRLREVVRKHASQASETLVPPGEPGEPIAISGVVRDELGQPVAGALVTIFQTDAAGLYAKSDAERRRMDEPNSRIFGFLRTGADGKYEFRTVRPGGYPFPLPNMPGDQAWIPAHIHFLVSAAGYADFGCGHQNCQIVFADDPRMTAHWQEWARKLTFPVLTLGPVANGLRRAVLDVSLRRTGKS